MNRTETEWLWNPREKKCLFLLQQRNTRATLLQIHAFFIQNALHTNINILTKLIDAFASADPLAGISHARRIFDFSCRKDDTFLCNTMVKSHLNARQFTEATLLYRYLLRNVGFKPDNYTFVSLAKCCGLNAAFFEGLGVHNHSYKSGFASNLYVATALVDMYGKFGEMGFARKMFDEMTERSSVSWTALIDGYVKSGDMGSAMGLFYFMPEKDVAAYNVMIDAHVKIGEMGLARSLFETMPERNVVSWTSLIDGYCTVGNVTEARLLFDAMPVKNLHSWNAIIGGYSQNKQPHEALSLFHQLQMLTTFQPDNVTLVTVLPAIADLGALELGNWIYHFARRKKLERSSNVCTALIDMYAKCGEIKKARDVFDGIPVKEISVWNALINGLAVNGRAEEALELFLQMRNKGLSPNEVTMLGVLTACNHGGLVEDGKRWFMELDEFGLTPRIEHYGCMVDLLGRAGYLDEAESLIDSMPYEVNGIILSSFLFACYYAKDTLRAERVIRKAIDMDPTKAGNYIVLRNLYASERRWNDVEEIKGLMNKKGAKKEAGCSSIEVNGRVCEFVAGSKLHPQSGEVHFALDQLQLHMKAKGAYFPDEHLKLLEGLKRVSMMEDGNQRGDTLIETLLVQGLQAAQMLNVLTATLYRQFIQKDVNNFEDFHTAILDIFSTVNAALPGKHYDVPPLKEVEACFEKWSSAYDSDKRGLFVDFLTKQLKLSQLDDFSLITGLVTPPAAMAAKRAGETLPQLKLIKVIPDVVFVPTATVFALISVKLSRKMFLRQVASGAHASPQEHNHNNVLGPVVS